MSPYASRVYLEVDNVPIDFAGLTHCRRLLLRIIGRENYRLTIEGDPEEIKKRKDNIKMLRIIRRDIKKILAMHKVMEKALKMS